MANEVAVASTAGTMESAHIWVEINTQHDNIQLKHITPAEALVVRRQFGIKVPGQAKPNSPITHLNIHKQPLARTKDEEYGRLVRKYGEKLIGEVFPGEQPNIPLSFKDAGLDATKELEPAKHPEHIAHKVLDLTAIPKSETTDKA